MTDIFLIARIGEPISKIHRNLLFSLAQYMLKIRLETVEFEVESQSATFIIDTDFKTGRQDSVEGIIFRACIRCDNATTRAIFLAEYRPGWCEQYVEEMPFLGINENWRN
jgi:hypothetical protein